MTVLVTADLHLSDNPRDAYRHEAMRTIREIGRKNKVSHILILGDLTEEKDRHSAWLVNKVVEHLDKFADIAPVTILRGNHDYIVAESPFYAFVNRIPDIAWINRPKEVELDDLGLCLFLPHTSNWQDDWEGLKLKKYDRIFAHNSFEGAAGDNGHQLKGIPPSIFGKDKNYVIAGDVHVPQSLGPVTYVGAPYTVDFGDNYTPRVLLLEKSAFTRTVEVPGAQKRLVEVDSSGKLLAGGAEPGDIVKIRVNLKSDEYSDWAKIRDNVKGLCGDQGVQVYSISPVVEKAKAKPVKQEPQSRLSDESVLRQYVKNRGVDSKTEKVGLKLLQEN